ncbi:MAG: threonine/serine exporter family protein [Muribaculaceae bacterium]|nr:threonine/serine exporter family protein [Muribaculaceae bacterium]
MKIPESSARADTDLNTLLDFLSEYCRRLLASGVHTSRVIRNSVRIAASQDTELNVLVTLRCLILTLRAEGHCDVATRVVTVTPMPISFELNSELSALSWQAIDDRLSFDEIRSRYLDIISRPRLPHRLVTTLLSLANGAFCYLFHGDILAIVIVILATAVGFSTKSWLAAHKVNVFFVVAISAFVASLTASLSILADCTWQTALATSPLFLVPGVPLITCVIDAVEGHVLTAVSRLVNAILIVLCIAVGLAVTLLMVTDGLPVES